MALFPAYSLEETENLNIEDSGSQISGYAPVESTESQLLASDSDEEKTSRQPSEPGPKFARQDQNSEDFYVDCKLDRGNLRVSTLYYPGRPHYSCAGGEGGARTPRRRRRYFSRRAPDAADAPAAAARAAAYRELVAQRPHDAALWERFIDFQETCSGAEAALSTAEEAAARGGSRRLRARLLAAARLALPPRARLERLRDMLAAEKSAEVRTELWEHLLSALAATPEGDAAQLTSAAAAALADTRSCAFAYPRLLYSIGSYLRSAGLWERLVLLIELVVALNYAPVAFPPPSDPEFVERCERRLVEFEDKVAESGLPLSAMWVRVERARAAAHWRGAGPAGAAGAGADPQRAPLAHDVAELLQPAAAGDVRLAASLLLLAKVPLLPGAQWLARWAGDAAADGPEALLPLLLEAPSLPPAHPARALLALAPRLLALLLDPPHYFSDDTGFLSWVNALWDACCSRAAGAARAALLCWRLRWLRARLLAAGGAEPSLREEARALLRRLPAASPLPFAEFARLELLAAGRDAALRVASRALRAALLDPACPPHHALYVARIVCEVGASSDGAQLSAEGACAMVCAALGRTPPSPLEAPSKSDLDAALSRCERQCDILESELEADDGDEGAARDEEALLPAAGEWARARALLAGPARRRRLLRALRARARPRRYWEDGACALAAAAAREGRAAPTARLLAPLFPDNAYLAIAGAGAPLWAPQTQTQEERLRAMTPRTDVGALAAMLPSMLRALEADFAPPETQRAVRAARRATAGAAAAGRGALLWGARLELEARAPAPRPEAALFAALDAAPAHKWLHVRGAACGERGAALADALLERGLRLHALPDELRPRPD